MIQAFTTTPNGRTLIFIDVKDQDVERLITGHPILMKGTSHDPAIDVMIKHDLILEDVIDALIKEGINVQPVNERPQG